MKLYCSYNPDNGCARIVDENGKLLDEATSYTMPAVYVMDGSIYAAFADYWKGTLPVECVIKVEIVGGEYRL